MNDKWTQIYSKNFTFCHLLLVHPLRFACRVRRKLPASVRRLGSFCLRHRLHFLQHLAAPVMEYINILPGMRIYTCNAWIFPSSSNYLNNCITILQMSNQLKIAFSEKKWQLQWQTAEKYMCSHMYVSNITWQISTFSNKHYKIYTCIYRGTCTR